MLLQYSGLGCPTCLIGEECKWFCYLSIPSQRPLRRLQYIYRDVGLMFWGCVRFGTMVLIIIDRERELGTADLRKSGDTGSLKVKGGYYLTWGMSINPTPGSRKSGRNGHSCVQLPSGKAMSTYMIPTCAAAYWEVTGLYGSCSKDRV